MDSTFGKVNKVVGDFTLKMDPAKAKELAKDLRAKTAFANALASSIGLSADDIHITEIWLDGVKVAGRRLADSAIKVKYEILTTSTTSTAAATIKEAELAKAVVKESQAVLGLTIPKPTVTASTPTVSSVGKDAMCKDATSLCKNGFRPK